MVLCTMFLVVAYVWSALESKKKKKLPCSDGMLNKRWLEDFHNVEFKWSAGSVYLAPTSPSPTQERKKKNTKKNKYIVWESKSTSPLECGHLFPFSYCQFHTAAAGLVCLLVKKVNLYVLRFYSPVNPMGSCRAWSVYLTTRLLGRLSPLCG